jgi:hypothetical protein
MRQEQEGKIMFDDVIGLHPEDAARWTALVEQCRPILESNGMEAVQTFLADHGMSIIQAITITWALLGRGETPLRVGLNLTEVDLPQTKAGFFYPIELVLAVTLTWLFSGQRSDEIARLRTGRKASRLTSSSSRRSD